MDTVAEIDKFPTGCASKMLRVSTKTLERWDKSGYLKACRTPGNARYYTRAQLEEFIRSTYVVKRRDGFFEYRPRDHDHTE